MNENPPATTNQPTTNLKADRLKMIREIMGRRRELEKVVPKKKKELRELTGEEEKKTRHYVDTRSPLADMDSYREFTRDMHTGESGLTSDEQS